MPRLKITSARFPEFQEEYWKWFTKTLLKFSTSSIYLCPLSRHSVMSWDFADYKVHFLAITTYKESSQDFLKFYRQPGVNSALSGTNPKIISRWKFCIGENVSYLLETCRNYNNISWIDQNYYWKLTFHWNGNLQIISWKKAVVTSIKRNGLNFILYMMTVSCDE